MHKKSLDGAVGMDGRLVVKKISGDGSEAIRVADDAGQSVTADRAIDGKASYEITGKSRQNEDGVLDVCSVLADHLRATGIPVGEPRMRTGPERGVDCEISSGETTISIQVTRPADPDVWRTLARFGTTKREFDTSRAIDDLLELIRRKAAKTTIKDRSHIVLALDATETAVHAMSGVVSTFRQMHGESVRSLGFAAVWVVGPERGSVYRLDGAGEPA